MKMYCVNPSSFIRPLTSLQTQRESCILYHLEHFSCLFLVSLAGKSGLERFRSRTDHLASFAGSDVILDYPGRHSWGQRMSIFLPADGLGEIKLHPVGGQHRAYRTPCAGHVQGGNVQFMARDVGKCATDLPVSQHSHCK